MLEHTLYETRHRYYIVILVLIKLHYLLEQNIVRMETPPSLLEKKNEFLKNNIIFSTL